MSSHLTRRLIMAGVVSVAIATAAFAHHGWGAYDEKQPLTVAGTITESKYANPHGSVKLRAADGGPNGGKVWDVVLAPVSRMKARGLTEAMLGPGTKATVLGYPHRQTPTEMRAENITIDEKKVELR